MKRFLLPITALFLFSQKAYAGMGLWNTLFGDGDNEFVCYSRVHRNFFLAIFAGVLATGIIAWRLYRLKKKSAEQLAEQKTIIEEQNKDILDSIRYASRMQEAIKPDASVISSALPHSFFFLKPRDIVSGDFYFVDHCRDKLIIAAMDCTGHGVPGAFLTFIGHNALRHAIEKTGSEHPSVLLDAMNREVKNTLGQQRPENELNDGMEVGLCVLDPKTGRLDYAGAGSALYLFRDDKLEEIKPAKCTVGSIQSHVTEAPPVHSFTLKPGDSFYLGSDGIPDQFGGPEGKKFRKEQLRNMLREINHLSPNEQLATVEETMSNWMRGHKQTDDMLLLGVRFA